MKTGKPLIRIMRDITETTLGMIQNRLSSMGNERLNHSAGNSCKGK